METAPRWRRCLDKDDIPPGRVDPHVNDVSIFLWVHTGSMVVTVEGDDFTVTAGSAMWVPAGLTESVRHERGTVVIPTWARTQPDTDLSHPRVVNIPPEWENWLMHKHGSGPTIEDAPLLELAGRSDRTSASPRHPPLPMPRSPEARAVTQLWLRAPGTALGAERLAAGQNVSAKTLRRQFLSETGISLSEWRTRARVVAAARHLASGRTVGWTRKHVGYATPAGFTRAFQRHLGLAPREYAEHSRSSAPVDDVASALSRLAADDRLQPPPIPAYNGPAMVNDCHVLLWAYRGKVTVHIGTSARTLARGEAIWVPAGVSHRVDIAAESTLLLLGNRYGRVGVGVEDLQVFRFPPDAEAYLLHVSVVEYSLVQPDVPPSLTDELFQEQFIRSDPCDKALTGAIGIIATAVRRDPADSRTLADWARTLSTTTDALSREFKTQTGTTFPRWRAQLRMNIARDLLDLGERPGMVARKLGYASHATFTKVFTAAHGLSPRAFQRQETGRTA